MAITRAEFIRVRVTADEKARIEQAARASERSLSQQVRFVLRQAVGSGDSASLLARPQ